MNGWTMGAMGALAMVGLGSLVGKRLRHVRETQTWSPEEVERILRLALDSDRKVETVPGGVLFGPEGSAGGVTPRTVEELYREGMRHHAARVARRRAEVARWAEVCTEATEAEDSPLADCYWSYQRWGGVEVPTMYHFAEVLNELGWPRIKARGKSYVQGLKVTGTYRHHEPETPDTLRE